MCGCGLALCLALLLSYGFLVATTIAKAGPARHVRKADFVIVLTGAAILAGGHPAQLYDETAQQAAQATLLRAAGLEPLRLLPFNHPPFEALLVAGLEAAGLTPEACFWLWTLLSLAAVGGALAALRWGWPLAGPPGLLLTGAALTFFPITAGLLLGQSTALVLLGWAAGSAALRRGHDGWAGAALALAMLKPQAVPVLLLALLLLRRWRALAAWAATVVGAVIVTLPILGFDWPVRYLAFVLHVAAQPPSPALDPAIMQNWRGLFIHLLGDSTSGHGAYGGGDPRVAGAGRADLAPGRRGAGGLGPALGVHLAGRAAGQSPPAAARPGPGPGARLDAGRRGARRGQRPLARASPGLAGRRLGAGPGGGAVP